MLSSRRLLVFLGLLTCFFLALPAAGAVVNADVCAEEVQPACGEEERQAYLNAANSGMEPEVLNSMYADCAHDTAPLGVPEKIITVNNGVGSIFYEQMNGCGYHPQTGLTACDVEVKQRFGYGPFGPAPWAGSFEYVTFCYFCGGPPIAVTGSVHVTDDISGTPPSYGFTVSAFAPNVCPPPGGGSGATFQVRATLSWAVPATAPCSTTPGLVWGNQITFDARDDP